MALSQGYSVSLSLSHAISVKAWLQQGISSLGRRREKERGRERGRERKTGWANLCQRERERDRKRERKSKEN